MMAGIWIFGQLADRIGRKPSFLLFQLGAVISIVVYSQLTDPDIMLLAGAFFRYVCERNAGRLRCIDGGSLPNRSSSNGTKRTFQYWSCRRGFGPVVVGSVVLAYSFPNCHRSTCDYLRN